MGLEAEKLTVSVTLNDHVVPRSFIVAGEKNTEGALGQYPFSSGLRALRIHYDLGTYLATIHGRVKQGYRSYMCGSCRLDQIESANWQAYIGFAICPERDYQRHDLFEFEAAMQGRVGAVGHLDDGKKSAGIRMLAFASPEAIKKQVGLGDMAGLKVEWILLALEELMPTLPVEIWRSVSHNPIEIHGHELRWVERRNQRAGGFHWGMSKSELNWRNRAVDKGIRDERWDWVEEALSFDKAVGFWRVISQQKALQSRAVRLLAASGSSADLPWSMRTLSKMHVDPLIASSTLMLGDPRVAKRHIYHGFRDDLGAGRCV